ncbi:hypothetical protein CC78DRAFT_437290, partial [Lojkania enalia]
AVVSLPVVLPTAYLAYLHLTLKDKVQCQTTPHLQDDSVALPKEVCQHVDEYIIWHERAWKNIQNLRLATNKGLYPELLTSYLRHNMLAFIKAPPAWAIKRSIADPNDRVSFEPDYIRGLGFEEGDRVCGVYAVSSRGQSQIVLKLDAPASYNGPKVEGLLAVEIENETNEDNSDLGAVRIINDVVLWRKKIGGEKLVLERAVGRWVHSVLVRWMVQRGV